MERNEKVEEPNFTKKDGSVDLKAVLTCLMQRFLGKALDYARISGMSDRGFTQFQRSLKDDHYTILGYGTTILKEHGLLKYENESNGSSK